MTLADVGDGFCHVFGPALEIRCFDGTGRPTTIARVDSLPRPVTPNDIESAFQHELTRARENWNEALEGALLRVRPSMAFPGSLPTFTALLADDTGRIWARRYALPGHHEAEW